MATKRTNMAPSPPLPDLYVSFVHPPVCDAARRAKIVNNDDFKLSLLDIVVNIKHEHVSTIQIVSIGPKTRYKMKFHIIGLILLATVLIYVECKHLFIGTNVHRPLVYHHDAQYGSKVFRKRIENIYYALPSSYINSGGNIKGILAYDKTYSDASANVTQGGIGYNYVNIRMKSSRGKDLHFNIYIYGILAYDLTYSGASANVTQGGVGYNFVNLRLKSDSGKNLNYDIYIYA
ncbi:uncharacterized protein ACR2FA_004252 [Aphomia sociella]